MTAPDIARGILDEASKISCDKPIIISIDGRCASGKTTIAQSIRDISGCNVVHMDDFYLPKEKRTDLIMSRAGGNIDFSRIISEVLEPIKNGNPIAYRPYVCSTGSFGELVTLPFQRINVLEGSYSCHPQLYGYADLRVFADVNEDEQLCRIKVRNGSAYSAFAEVWIPREERYFKEFSIKDKCTLYYQT